MKNIFFTLLLAVLFAAPLYSQSVINQPTAINNDGTTANPSAMLDVKAADKGLLIPRVEIFDFNTPAPVTSPAKGLLVFHSHFASEDGFYFWDGFKWVLLSTVGSDLQTLVVIGDSLEISDGNKISILQTQIVDGDGDTKVVADEDFVQVQVDDTVRVQFERARMEFLNSGRSVFIGENAGMNDDLSNNKNVFIGNDSGKSNSTGSDNVASGSSALRLNTTGSDNVANGSAALDRNTIGDNNVANGSSALRLNTTGDDNVAIGSSALELNTTGSSNIAVGDNAGRNANSSNKLYIENSNVDSNAALIYGVMDNGAEMLRINGAFEISEPDSITNNFEVSIDGEVTINEAYTLPSADGIADQALTTDGSGNVTWQSESQTLVPMGDSLEISDGNKVSILQSQIADGDRDTKVVADEDFVQVQVDDTVRVQFEGARMEFLNSGESVFIGEDAGMNDNLSANRNTFVGSFAGKANTSGTNNVFVGRRAGVNSQTSHNNVGIGVNALQGNTGNGANVAVGSNGLGGNSTGRTNTGVGRDAGRHNTTGNDNVFLGDYAGRGLSDYAVDSNVIIGAKAGYKMVSGMSYNTFLGFESGYNVNGTGNVFLGFQAGWNETGSNKLYIENSDSIAPLIYGDFANDTVCINGTFKIKDEYHFPMTDGTADQVLTTDGSGEVTWESASGGGSQSLISTGDSLEISSGNKVSIAQMQIVDGDQDTKVVADEDFVQVQVDDTVRVQFEGARMEFKNSGNSVFIGEDAGISDDLSANQNVYIGHFAGKTGANNTTNVAVGAHALENASGNSNIGIGPGALKAMTSNINVGIGRDAGLFATSGTDNVFLGDYTARGGGNYSTPLNNVIIGAKAGQLIASNSTNNVVVGRSAGYNLSGSGNVYLGFLAGYNHTGNNKLYIENSDSAIPLIYGNFQSDKVGINIIASGNTLEVGGEASKATSGPWAANSDARLKKNIRPLRSEETLQRLLQLQGVTYEWNDDKTAYERPEGIQYGFTAQNIQKVFPTLVSEDALGYLQTAYSTYDAMYIEAIRALNKKIETLEKENVKLKTELSAMAELKAEVEGIKQLLLQGANKEPKAGE